MCDERCDEESNRDGKGKVRMCVRERESERERKREGIETADRQKGESVQGKSDHLATQVTYSMPYE